LVGTNWVAQIVYWPSWGGPSKPLGALMPFRLPTTAFPGTWNPGAAGIRTFSGFPIGSTVVLQVRVWDSTVFGSWDEAALVLANGGGHGVGTAAGTSSVFTYLVGDPDLPSTLVMSNFRGFQLTALPSCPMCPPPCYSTVNLDLVAERTGSELVLDLWTRLLAAARLPDDSQSIGSLSPSSPVGALLSNESPPPLAMTNNLGVLSGSLERAVWKLTPNRWRFDPVPLSLGIAMPYRPGDGRTPPSCGRIPGTFSFTLAAPAARPVLRFNELSSALLEVETLGVPGSTYRLYRSDDLVAWRFHSTITVDGDGQPSSKPRESRMVRSAFWRIAP
jgi:hypothetical protein